MAATEKRRQILDDIEKGMKPGGHERITKRRAAIQRALEESHDGDVVLLAGKGHETGQEIAGTVPGANVVKAFNTTFAGTLAEGRVAGTQLDVFLASDDEAAKATVSQLAADGGLRAIDVGPLALAHQLEGVGYMNMAIQPGLGTNYGSALKVVA